MATDIPWGRIADDGTVFVRSTDGEREVGSWHAGTSDEGLAHFIRRFDDLATEVTLLETRLKSRAASASSTVVAATKLRASLPTANVVGDISSLDERLSALLDSAQEKRAEEKSAKAAATEAAAQAKQTLVEEAEALAQSGQWKSAGDRLRAIVEEWRTIKGVDRKLDSELWKRVSAARSEFGRRRGAHFATLDEQRKESVTHKEKVVGEAEALSTSSEWTTAANRFKALMSEWKAIGRATKDVDDALWKRFRAAQDTFFTRRSAAFDERDSEQKANQTARESVLREAETLDPTTDLAAAQAKLRELQARYSSIGKVPRDAMTALDKRLDAVAGRVRDASEAKWRESNLSSSPLVLRLRESVEKLERKIKRAREAGQAAQVRDLQTQLDTQRQWLAQSERSTS